MRAFRQQPSNFQMVLLTPFLLDVLLGNECKILFFFRWQFVLLKQTQ